MSAAALDTNANFAATAQRLAELEAALSREVALRQKLETQLQEQRQQFHDERLAALSVAQDAAEANERLEHRTQELARSNQELTALTQHRERLLADAQKAQRAAMNLLRDADQARRDLAKKAVELERSNKELDEFAYVASHDLKSPLAAIKNLAGWIKEDAASFLPEKSQKHLAQMQQRVARLERLLDDLLQYSRAGRVHGQIIQIDASRLVRDIAGMLDKPQATTVSVAEGLPKFVTARTPFELVMRNLISNAIKHRDRDDVRIEVTSRENGPFFEFTVADNGPGIDARFHEQAFKMFETLRPRDEVEGSGMGLAIIRKTIESYGGTIRLESAPGQGAKFHFTWPKTMNRESPNKATPSKSKIVSNGLSAGMHLPD